MGKMGKKILIVACFLFVVFSVGAYVFISQINEYKDAISRIVISEHNISKIADGTYYGEYDAMAISVKLSIKVADGKILSIDLLEHRNGRGSQAETIVDRMILEQRIGVDSVTGATNSSIVIKKAVDVALESAPKK